MHSIKNSISAQRIFQTINNIKLWIPFFLILVLLFALPPLPLISHALGVNSYPASTKETTLSWQRVLYKEKGTWGNTTTTPLLTTNSLYIACDNVLYQLDKTNGTIKKEILLEGMINHSYTISSGGNMIFVPISDGRIQAINEATGTSLWVSETFEGYSSNCTPIYRDGKLYSAISMDSYDENWVLLGSKGLIYCLDVTDNDPSNKKEIKEVEWTYMNNDGHYWTTPFIHGELLLIGSDKGTMFCLDRKNGERLCSSPLAATGSIRMGIAYDAKKDLFYTVSSQAEAIAFKVSKTEITKVKSTVLKPNGDSSYLHSTSTPVLYGEKLYLLSNYSNPDGSVVGLINVLDKDLTIKYQINTPVMSQSTPLVTSDGKNHYVYFTSNDVYGRMYCATDTGTASSCTVPYLFTPKAEHQQYCCSNIIADPNINGGTLFYSNDSGTIFAIGKVTPPTKTPSPSPPRINTYAKPPAKVTRLRTTISKKKKAGKKKVTFSWKKLSGVIRYEAYAKKISAKKYKRIAVLKKNSLKKSYKKGTYLLKIRAYKMVKGKKLFGKFSNIKRFRVR